MLRPPLMAHRIVVVHGLTSSVSDLWQSSRGLCTLLFFPRLEAGRQQTQGDTGHRRGTRGAVDGQADLR
jgi:hypothetical protein